MADITIKPLSHPVMPKVNNKTYEAKNYVKKDKAKKLNLQTKELQKTNVQVLPAGVHNKPIKVDNKLSNERIDIKIDDSSEELAQKIIDKQRELDTTSSELQSVAEKKRQLEIQVKQLNSELDKLRESEKDVQIKNAEFRLNRDDEEFFVELLDAEEGTIIKELTLKDMEKVLDKASGDSKGVLLDLFA